MCPVKQEPKNRERQKGKQRFRRSNIGGTRRFVTTLCSQLDPGNNADSTTRASSRVDKLRAAPIQLFDISDPGRVVMVRIVKAGPSLDFLQNLMSNTTFNQTPSRLRELFT